MNRHSMQASNDRIARSAPDATAGEAPPVGLRATLGHWIRSTWRWFWSPSAKYSLGFLVIVSFVAGILFWGGFHTAMELTNTESFCVSCHEMQSNVYREYQQTIHYTNRSGVRAVCTDCHVPKDWYHKTIRKIQASNEVFHHLLGSINTREKFVEKRIDLAKNVWRAMKTTDSRECRNCHNIQSMDFSAQEKRSAEKHQLSLKEGSTCIDCHAGIAHRLPAGAKEALEDLQRELGPRAGLENYLKEATAGRQTQR
jgi:cytochrome c-type protein NapC